MAMEHYTYSNIGETLQSTREQLGKSRDEVAAELYIRKIYITALEQGNIDALPSEAFARGYLESYARWLQLEPIALLKQFEQAGRFPKDGSFTLPEAPKSEVGPNQHLLVISGILVLVLAVFWYAWSSPEQHMPPVDTSSVMASPAYIVQTAKEPLWFVGSCAFAFREGYKACYYDGWVVYVITYPQQPVRTVMEIVR